MIRISRHVGSPVTCSECGITIKQGERIYTHSEDAVSPEKPRYCSHDHIIRHTLCGEKI